MPIETTTTFEVKAKNYKGNPAQATKTWLKSLGSAELEAETLRSLGWADVTINEVPADVYAPPTDPTPSLLDTLHHAPRLIARATKRRNAVAALFEACEARLILEAYSAELFPDKKDASKTRPADNAEERKLAIALTLAEAREDRHSAYAKLAKRMEAANVALAHARDEFEAAQTAARLIVARLRTN